MAIQVPIGAWLAMLILRNSLWIVPASIEPTDFGSTRRREDSTGTSLRFNKTHCEGSSGCIENFIEVESTEKIILRRFHQEGSTKTLPRKFIKRENLTEKLTENRPWSTKESSSQKFHLHMKPYEAHNAPERHLFIFWYIRDYLQQKVHLWKSKTQFSKNNDFKLRA